MQGQGMWKITHKYHILTLSDDSATYFNRIAHAAPEEIPYAKKRMIFWTTTVK
jgi:hypothetical protein